MKKKYFGIVEGFFSQPLNPWTMQERSNVYKFIAEYASNINMYFYCPKDDPYVTTKWDSLYPQKQASKLINFIKLNNTKRMKFVYGFNPLFDARSDMQEVKIKTLKKIYQLLMFGCKNIALLFDDIPLAYDALGNTIDQKNECIELITFINEIYNDTANYVEDFWVCLPDYNFTNPSPMTKAAKNLKQNIGVIWSGNNVFSKMVTKKDITRVKKLLFPNVRLIFWSNYPVNDCEQAIGTFNLGGFYPIKKDALTFLDGVIVNPMREVYANLPFLITFSKYAAKPLTYNRSLEWNNALKIFGFSKNTITYINTFNSKNFIDPIAFSCPQLQSEKKVKKKFWNNLFLQSIQQVFIDARCFRLLRKQITTNKLISQKTFAQYDWFPTRENVSRYLPEIFVILQKRFSLYKNYAQTNYTSPKEIQYVKSFSKRYTGRNKLNIPPKDNKKALISINNLIHAERSAFLKIIQNPKISSDQRILLLYLRKQINRFTSERYVK